MIIKHVPEDFIVEEIPQKSWDDDGKFSVFKLAKIDMNTQKAIEIISRRFNIPSNDIKYSGTKDRHARTIQYISIPKKDIHHNLHIDEENLKLEHAGFNDEPLSLGTLKGNKFMLTLRELTHDEIRSLRHFSSISKSGKKIVVPNYFDDQRFSSNNYHIGLNIIKGKYKEAVELICDGSESFSKKAQEYMSSRPNDYIGVLRSMPRKILMLFIHSVQSYIFNEALYLALKDNCDSKNLEYYAADYSLGKLLYYRNIDEYGSIIESLELPGFNSHSLNHHVKKLMEDMGINPRSFIIKALPDLSVEGTSRECLVEIENLDIRILDDHAIAEFSLCKGSYATIAIKGLAGL